MSEFNKKILMIGYGAVARCTLPLLLKHLAIPENNVTVIDFVDKTKELEPHIQKGLKFFKKRINPGNLSKILKEFLSTGDILIDLAWNIDCCELLHWCHDNQVLYINTSVEQWDPVKEAFSVSPYEKTLYFRQMKINKLTEDWKDSTTAVVDHGANPGLISHFTKQGLIDIANKLIVDKKAIGEEAEDIKRLCDERKFGELAMKLGVKVIHCSERDTQITNRPKDVDEFVGTWSIEGLREEGTATAEMGWGTHEKKLPEMAHFPPVGPKNQIYITKMGMNTWIRSWIPHEEIVGMIIRHGEAFGISDRLTVWKNGKAIYRPTVHYAYMPCHETLSSLCELRGRNYEMQNSMRIMNDEITKGEDILGALLMGHHYNSWWTGSILSIGEARRLVPGQNATTLQVAISVVAATMWMLENPKKGVCLPDDLPHDFILKIAKPYLGKLVSKPSDWTPLKNRKTYFKENPASKQDKKNIWQFHNFEFIP